MFSCCAASTFIKFTAGETAWLVIFPEESPEAGQGLSDINVSSETMGVQETPFLTPHNKSLPYAHIYSALRRIFIHVVHPQTHPPLGTHNSEQIKSSNAISSGEG